MIITDQNSEDGKPESSAAYGPAIGHARVGISQGQHGYMTLEAVEVRVGGGGGGGGGLERKK